MRVTIKDIAKQVGTVPSTVSRALNHKGGVGEKRRAQILKVAKQLGYFPNGAARGLVLNKTENLGFLVNRRQSLRPASFYGEIMSGVEAVTSEKYYHLVFATNDSSEALPRVIQTRRVDGLILAGCDFKEDLVLKLKGRGIPVVLVDNHLNDTQVDSVVIDNVGGAYRAVVHLAKLGHQRIGFIVERLCDLSFAERFTGYKQALAAQGLSYAQALVAEGVQEPNDRYDDGSRYGRIAMRRLLDRELPTAVFAANDATAIGAMQVIKEAGLRVPEDVAIVGFDDGPIARHTDPPLSTMRVFAEQMGRAAAKRLIELVEEPEQPAVQIKLATELVVRGSCGSKQRRSHTKKGRSFISATKSS
ncbi:MAG TPA: LacI family transcriptional regulator [Candidatus Fraserbacteria bacterium]|nr:LacI family transcriptional regulator [Candidatus Fraserbacteria bacterium]